MSRSFGRSRDRLFVPSVSMWLQITMFVGLHCPIVSLSTGEQQQRLSSSAHLLICLH